MTTRAVLPSPVLDTRVPVRRGFLVALALSVGVHLLALMGVPRLDIAWLRTDETASAKPLQARIVPAPQPPTAVAAVTPKPAPRPAVPKPRPKPAPPVPSSMALEADEPPPAVNEQLRDRHAMPEPDVVPPELPPEPSPLADATAASPEKAPAPSAAEAAAGDAPKAADVSPSVPETKPEAPTATAPDIGPPASYPLKSVRLVYDLSYGFAGSVVGSVSHALTIDGANYQVETIVSPTGIAAVFYGGRYVQRSRGRLGRDGFVPDEYFVMRGQEIRSERASFDWAAKKILFSWPVRDASAPDGWRTETRSGELAAGTQDPVSMLHQLFFMQPLEKSSRLAIASSRKVSQHAYEVIGEEVLKTPLGEVNTIRVRRRDEESDRLDLWLDPSRNLMPLKIYYEDRRRTVLEQNIREFSVEAAP